MINIFLDKCLYSPFDFPILCKKMASNNIVIVKRVESAHIVISSYLNILKKYSNKKGLKLLLWTHEPYHDWTLEQRIKLNNNVYVNIMNCYTNNVFTHNYRYFYFKTPLNLLSINSGDENIKIVPKICALSTFYEPDYYNKNPRSILPIRYNLILYGYEKNIVDIYGKGWDKYGKDDKHKIGNFNIEVITCGNSRNDVDRRNSKASILADYNFNICLENAVAPYYITEKIWEAIKYGCLPIYYSNSTIYDIFPKNSFIDYNDYGDYIQLYNAINNMSILEYKTRMNLCIKVFNKIINEGNNNIWRGDSKNLNINYLEYNECTKQLINVIKSL